MKSQWIVIGFLLKITTLVFLEFNLAISPFQGGEGFINSGDAFAYINNMENIKEFGVFALDRDPDSNKPIPYAGRMPGYEIITSSFRYFFSQEITLYCIVITQIFISSMSIYALAYSSFLIFNSRRIFLIVFFLYGVNTYTTIFDIYILTESLAISSLIFSVYFFLKASKNKIRFNLFLSGLFFTWSIFLRPYIFAIWPILLFNLFLKYFFIEKIKFLKVLGYSLVLMSTFILVDGAWILRNYYIKQKFIPLVDDIRAGYNFPEHKKNLFAFVAAWGGDVVWWNPNAELALFIADSATSKAKGYYSEMNQLPDYIYTSKYNIDSLIKLKKYYSITENYFIAENIRIEKIDWINNSVPLYIESFKNEKPFFYYLYAPLRLLSKFVLHSGTYNISNKPFSQQNLIEKTFKIFHTFLYYFVLLGGGLGIMIWIYSMKSYPDANLAVYIACLILLLFPVYIRGIEYRYFVVAFPFFLLMASFALLKITMFIQRKTSSPNNIS